MDKAHSLGYVVAVDTNPEVFKHLGATYSDLKPFHDMGVDIIRLDVHLVLQEISRLLETLIIFRLNSTVLWTRVLNYY